MSFIDVPESSSGLFANGLNDLGDIVGVLYEDATWVFHGFVLSSGVLTVLDVPGGTGTLPGTFIHDIDNLGRLVEYYGEDLTENPFTYPRHGFLATPVPEPPLPALLAMGLAVMSDARAVPARRRGACPQDPPGASQRRPHCGRSRLRPHGSY